MNHSEYCFLKELKLERLPWSTLKPVTADELKKGKELFLCSKGGWQFELGGAHSEHLNLKKPTPVLEEFDKYLPTYSLEFKGGNAFLHYSCLISFF